MSKNLGSFAALLICSAGPLPLLSACASRSQQACHEPPIRRDNNSRQVTVLRDDLSPLRNEFNAMSDRWRAVSLVSPTCSECVYGAEVVQDEITSRFRSDQVATLTVWIPMLPSDDEAAARASATIFDAARASQYYDAQRTTGWEYARRTFAGFPQRARRSLPEGHWLTEAFAEHAELIQPQWDLYMLYAPGIRWEPSSAAPPMPTHWIRHFGRREDRKASTYWQDTPESGPREGDLHTAIHEMTDRAIGGQAARLDSPVNIEVLGFTDCPTTLANVRHSVAALGLIASVAYVDQEQLPEGDSRRSWPMPMVLVDDHDLFGLPAPVGFGKGCRIHPHGAPNNSEVIEALKGITSSPPEIVEDHDVH